MLRLFCAHGLRADSQFPARKRLTIHPISLFCVAMDCATPQSWVSLTDLPLFPLQTICPVRNLSVPVSPARAKHSTKGGANG